MDRMTSLAKVQEQVNEKIDTLKSTSIPQVKRYFRKRIRRALKEAKVHANSVKRTFENVASSTGVAGMGIGSGGSQPDMRQLHRVQCHELARQMFADKQEQMLQMKQQQQQLEHTSGAEYRRQCSLPVDYGWGSDFDDDDDEEDDEDDDDEDDSDVNDGDDNTGVHRARHQRVGDTRTIVYDADNGTHEQQLQQQPQSRVARSSVEPTATTPTSDHQNTSSTTAPTTSLTTSLSRLSFIEESTRRHHHLSRTPISHSISLLSLPNLHSSHRASIISSSSSASSRSSKVSRPSREPPPPPLPKDPPPKENSPMDRLTLYLPVKNGQDQMYEAITVNEANDNDEYLLPNSAPNNGTYEYVPFNKNTGSIHSSNSTNSSRYELEPFTNERPLPPIPADRGLQSIEDVEALLLKSFSWFHQIERDEAERLLKKMSVDGVYLVRPSKRAGAASPYTLTLFYSSRIFHLNIRRRHCDGQFALGMEKPREKTFPSVAELIKHHNSEPIYLTSKGSPAGKTRLLYTPS